MTLSEIIEKRRSIRKFDTNQTFDHHTVTKALELALLAPNSSNLQTWEFYRIRSKDKIAALVPFCLKQNAARSASELVLFVSRKDKWRERCAWHLKHIHLQIDSNLGDVKKHQKGLRYYGRSMPYFYRTDVFGIHTLIRTLNLWIHDLRNIPFLRWVSSRDTRVVSNKSIALAAENFMLSMTDQGYDTCPMEGFDGKKVKKLLGLPSVIDISMIVACGKGLPEGIYYDRQRLDYKEVVFEL